MNLNKDTTIPNTEECLKRLDIKCDPEIRHHSLYDAWLMMQAFSKLNDFEIINPLQHKCIFDEYEISSLNLPKRDVYAVEEKKC